MPRFVHANPVRLAAAVILSLSVWQRLPAQEQTLSNYPATAVCVSADGKQLAFAYHSFDSFNANSLAQLVLQPLPIQGGATVATGKVKLNGDSGFTCLAMSPDCRTWATMWNNKSIDLWDGISTKLMAKVELAGTDEATQLLFLDRRTLLIAGSTGGEQGRRGLLRLWDTKANEKIADFNPATQVQQLQITPDQTMLTLIDGEETVRLWTVKKKDDKYELEEKSTLKGHKGVTCHTISPDGKRMLTGGTDKKVRLWDVEKGKEITFLSGHADTVMWVAFTADGSAPISWSLDGTVRLWDVEADKEARVWKKEGFLSCYQISPDRKQLATGGSRGVIVWDLTKMAKEEKPPEKP
jgi:WD40 repeat protein